MTVDYLVPKAVLRAKAEFFKTALALSSNSVKIDTECVKNILLTIFDKKWEDLWFEDWEKKLGKCEDWVKDIWYD